MEEKEKENRLEHGKEDLFIVVDQRRAVQLGVEGFRTRRGHDSHGARRRWLQHHKSWLGQRDLKPVQFDGRALPVELDSHVEKA